MPAEHLALVVSGAHVQVGVERTVHGVDGAGQGHDLKAAAEGVGVVLLFRYIVYAHRKAVGSTQRLHGGKADVFLQGKLFDLFKDLLVLVDACNDLIAKTFVFHGEASPLCGFCAPPFAGIECGKLELFIQNEME